MAAGMLHARAGAGGRVHIIPTPRYGYYIRKLVFRIMAHIIDVERGHIATAHSEIKMENDFVVMTHYMEHPDESLTMIEYRDLSILVIGMGTQKYRWHAQGKWFDAAFLGEISVHYEPETFARCAYDVLVNN